MIIIKPSVELLWITPNAIQTIELAGRTCYKSENKITNDSAIKFIGKIMRLGHLSVIEHASASIKFVCDRGITHELVRHRLASYSQESSRYCSYGKAKFSGQIRTIEPTFKNEASKKIWKEACMVAERAYLGLLKMKESPQMARSILPTCLKTEIVMTCNFREWLHVFALRSSDNKMAHPQIREIIDMAKLILIKECPRIFNHQ